MAGSLQADEQPLDLVEFDHIAREARDMMRQPVIRRFGIHDMVPSREDAEQLARRLHGEIEPGGELVWEVMPRNPFAVFGGIGG